MLFLLFRQYRSLLNLHPGLDFAPTHNLLRVDHDAVRPLDPHHVMALAQPIPRQREGGIPVWEIA
jgi:hypothetical protein